MSERGRCDRGGANIFDVPGRGGPRVAPLPAPTPVPAARPCGAVPSDATRVRGIYQPERARGLRGVWASRGGATAMKFAVLDQCPAPRSVAPYIYLVLREAGQTASSIYRGEDAKALLHKLGKRTQAEIHRDLPTISNPAGQSQHECRSDGNANPGPVGRVLHEWEVGIDSGANDPASKARIEAAARHFGWADRHPYSRGVEGHHWCFAQEPAAHTAFQLAQVWRARVVLAIAPPFKPLREGAHGRRVRYLRKMLVGTGYLPGSDRGWKFGPRVLAAVQKFQRVNHLTADGVVGPATDRALRAAYKRAKGH